MQKYEVFDTKNVFSAGSEQNVTSTFTLPEYFPNVKRIVSSRATPSVAMVQKNDLQVLCVSGKLGFNIIFESDFANSLKSASFEEPFEFNFRLGNECMADDVHFDGSVSEMSTSARILSPRQIEVSAKIGANAVGIKMGKVSLYNPEENNSDDGICTLEQPVILTEKQFIPTSLVTVERDFTLPREYDSAKHIVYAMPCVSGVNVRCGDGKATYDGKMNLHFVYEKNKDEESADEPFEYVSFVQECDFGGEIINDNIKEDSLVVLRTTPGVCHTGVSYDPYGENRIFVSSTPLEIEGCVFNTYENVVCADVFSTKYDVDLKHKNATYENPPTNFDREYTLDEKISANPEDFEHILDSNMQISLVGTGKSDEGCFANARACLYVFGKGKDGKFNMAKNTFNVHLPINDIDAQGPLSDYFTAQCRGTEVFVRNGEMHCNANVTLKGALCTKNTVFAVGEVMVDKQTPVQEKDCSFVIYYPEKSDTLWSVAKKYKVSPQSIKEVNNLDENDNVSSRKTLTIM